jgi:adenylate cyclase
MTPSRPVPSPFGLGWARPLAQLNAPPGTTVRESFDRQLFVGTLGASAAFFVLSSVTFAPWMSANEVIAGLLAALLGVGVLFAFLVRGGSVAPYAHASLAFGFCAPVGGALLYPGELGWLNLMWLLPYPLTAALMTGVRGGLAWTVVSFAALAGVAWVKSAGVELPTIEVTEEMRSPPFLATSIASVAVYQMLAVTWFIQQREIVEDLLAEERRTVERLLLNVLPAPVAERLRRGEIVADQVDEVTVVFADLVGFTTLAAGLPARRVVEMLGEVFGAMDEIAEQEGMEKVKTIGDCYMAVAGAPTACRDHADRGLRFACRVRERLAGLSHHGVTLQVRIGVHSGPAMAGILGDKRMLYDLWGDTVNVAARLESTGEPGKVHASETTLRLAEQRWDAEDRGEVALKGRAPMRTAFVRGGEGERPRLVIAG